MTDHPITVVVPVLNEGGQLPALAAHLEAMDCPVIVVDGGSTDDTPAGLTALSDPRIRVRQAPAGRATQMNHGAALARTPFLLFLHADTRLPRNGIALVVDALQRPGVIWGRFDVSFDETSTVLRTIAWFMNWRSALSGICTGDQAIFATVEAFESVGGYPQQPLMEDIELSKSLKRIAWPARIRSPVVTASRRWRTHGVVRTVLTMWWLRLRYFLGASPDSLARHYRHAR